MKYSIQFFTILTLLFSTAYLDAQEKSQTNENRIEQEDIKKLIGEWSGSLTYTDYSSGKPYTMPCDVTINRKGKKLELNYMYPNEPKANGKGKISFSKDGTLINKKRILSRTTNSDGQIEIIAEKSGRDGNKRKKALIRNVYIIGDNDFIIRKEVKFNDSDEWIMRNQYTFKKK